jgi:hypothetical protein
MVCALCDNTGWVCETTPTRLGTATTAASAAVPECLASDAIRVIWSIRPGRRRARMWSSTRSAGAISERGWAREFDDPIALPDGSTLVPLLDAGNYIIELPKHVHTAAEWQAAMEALILVADLGGPTMFARIGVIKALNRHIERVFNPDRKDRHWVAEN